MVVKNRVSAAVAGLFLSAAVAMSPAAAQQPKSVASDSVFILRAGSLGLLQEKLGQMAEKKGSSAAVVAFGRRMATDYAKANQELEAAAKQSAFPAPVMLREHQQVFDRFNRTGRGSFDKKYMAEMVTQQREEVELFQQESAGGRVQSLKQLASKMLPGMEQRLSVATQTATSVGADVTASNSAARDRGATN